MRVATLFAFSCVALLVIFLYFRLLGISNPSLQPTNFPEEIMHRATKPWQQSLKEILISLQQNYRSQLPPSIHVVTEFEKIIQNSHLSNTSTTLNAENHSISKELLDVCPEEWISNDDVPFHIRGFNTINCTNVRPLSDVISVILNFRNIRHCRANSRNILSGINKFYPSISVYIPANFASCASTHSYNNIITVTGTNDAILGRGWNHLIQAARTPYVLIGRDLNYFDNFSQIERQIRMISYSNDISVAGGSQRNNSGHWRVGCYQLSLRNYILTYEEGYYVSRNECMFCDHLLGSFVAKKSLFSRFHFDTNLPASIIFEDFFIKLKLKHQLVVNCPDVMYFSTDPYELRRRERYLWLPLAHKLKINRILLPDNIVHSYSCAEVHISNCRSGSYPFMKLLYPVCCLEEFDRMVQFMQQFCDKNNIYIEYDAGAALGAVKLRTLTPWDIDLDATFYDTNYSLFLNSTVIFSDAGFLLTNFKPPNPKHAYFEAWTPGLRQQMWGFHVTSKDLFLDERFKDFPTKILMFKTWIHVEVNPALVARNLYGNEILKHSNSWLQLKMANGWAPYHPTKFLRCSKPGHHACQDQFLADGNLQFYRP